jgi:hypothetical protein
MTRAVFLTLAGMIALGVGAIAAMTPEFLLTVMKGATATPAALVMVRTTGVLLVFAGVLSLLVRHHPPSPTLRSVLIANACLQAMLLPIDPLAWASGAFSTIGSFLPNLVLHSALLGGFLFYLRGVPRPA